MKKMKLSIVIAHLAVVGLFATAALGHEFWLDLSKFNVKPGEVVQIRTMVGDEIGRAHV